ncbi:alpha/beta fold hydrolase [Sutcliffiella sp. NPDC057660]|uniref:alpha/beta fold hydrolase n=1 Tax=Sutcliffiella sp. NPDC057660 TaxID=3346199 RepID=UPI0036C5021B
MYKSKQEFVQVNGREIYVNLVGEGEAIIFLHGGPGSSHAFFLPHVLPLSEKFQLVLYDQNGCGKSGILEKSEYSMKDEVKTLDLLRQELSLHKLNIFGESWGSMLALLYATEYPENVNKLFLTAAIGVDATGYQQFKKELLKRLSFQDKVKLFLTDRKVKKGKASVEEVLKVIDPYYVYKKDYVKNKDQTPINREVNDQIGTDIHKHYSLVPKIHRLSNIPILVAQGSHDILNPTNIKALLLDYIPHARLFEIEECGHWTVVEKSEEINSLVVDFFSER